MKANLLTTGLMLAAAGVAVGFFIFDDSEQIDALLLENQELRQSLLLKSRPPERKGAVTIPKRTAPQLTYSAEETTRNEKDNDNKIHSKSAETEFRLKFDDPDQRRALDEILDTVFEQSVPAVHAEYSEVYEAFGLPQEDADELVERLAWIRSAAAEAEQYIMQLQEARNEYDKKIRTLLSEQDYAEYMGMEMRAGGRSQFGKFEDYLGPIPEEHKEQLIDLIVANEAYVNQWWAGPYDGIPRPAVGNRSVMELIQEDLDRISQGGSQLIAGVEEINLPEEYAEQLLRYYSDEYLKREKELLILKHREQNPEMHRQIFRAPPGKRQQIIDAIEAEIDQSVDTMP